MIEISKSQAKAFAIEIQPYIAEYIATHQEEYHAFLKEYEREAVA